MRTQRAVSFLPGLLLVISFGILIGCRSTPKIDWDARVGTFTYDQAVVELGPPDKTANLSDGSKVADWIQSDSGGGMSFGVGTGFSTGAVGVGMGHTTTSSASDRVLRLTFDPNNRLSAWSKNY